MGDQKKNQIEDKELSRRSFLLGLGKWSSIVVATVAAGIPRTAAAKEDPEAQREHLPGLAGEEGDSMEANRWWGRRCRVWGNRAGCRVWGNR
jgi:hypothetical protein